MKIIKASKLELPDIVLLNSFVQKAHFDVHPDVFKPVKSKEDVLKFFRKILKQESNYLFVAYQSDIAVGYAWAKLETKSDSVLKYRRRQIYLHQIVVHPEFRRNSIGLNLYKEVEKLAVQENINHLELDSWSFNNESHQFFYEQGFETYNVNMWKKINRNT